MNNGGKPAHNPLYTIQAGITIAFVLVEIGVMLFWREILTDPMIKNVWYILSVVIAVLYAPTAARRLAKNPGLTNMNMPGAAVEQKHMLRVYVGVSAFFSYRLVERFQTQFLADTLLDTWYIPLAIAVGLGVFLYWHYISKPQKEAHE